MFHDLVAHQNTIRLSAFAGILAVMAAWEWLAPRRRLTVSKTLRWTSNLGCAVLGTLLMRAVFPLLAVGLAAVAQQEGWGLFNRLALPEALEFIVAVAALDLAIYLQHALFHAVPTLWRLHRMHHTDTDFDTTTGVRFHPIEIALSMAIKLGAVAALGPAPGAVVLFEVLLSGTALFNHGNVRLPAGLDRWLRLVVVTPDMHRVHHSVYPAETNTNFGFNVPWWDRLFGTYCAQPRDGHEAMSIGLRQFRDPREQWLDRLLVQPVRGPASDYPLTNRSDLE